jgi:hypothetical protein
MDYHPSPSSLSLLLTIGKKSYSSFTPQQVANSLNALVRLEESQRPTHTHTYTKEEDLKARHDFIMMCVVSVVKSSMHTHTHTDTNTGQGTSGHSSAIKNST